MDSFTHRLPLDVRPSLVANLCKSAGASRRDPRILISSHVSTARRRGAGGGTEGLGHVKKRGSSFPRAIPITLVRKASRPLLTPPLDITTDSYEQSGPVNPPAAPCQRAGFSLPAKGPNDRISRARLALISPP